MSQIKDFENCLGALTVLSTEMLAISFWDQRFNMEPDRPVIIVSLIPEKTHTHTYTHTHTHTYTCTHTLPKRASDLKGLEEPL